MEDVDRYRTALQRIWEYITAKKLIGDLSDEEMAIITYANNALHPELLEDEHKRRAKENT